MVDGCLVTRRTYISSRSLYKNLEENPSEKNIWKKHILSDCQYDTRNYVHQVLVHMFLDTCSYHNIVLCILCFVLLIIKCLITILMDIILWCYDECDESKCRSSGIAKHVQHFKIQHSSLKMLILHLCYLVLYQIKYYLHVL